jgi:sugar/nucleoside kinase (ribokinase family)
MALSKLKSNVAIQTVVGTDEAGTQLESDLKTNGINTELIRKDAKNPTNSSYILSISSDRTLFSYHYSRNYELPELPETRYVLLTSIGEDDKRLFDALIAQKKTKNFQLIFSPGTRQVKEPLLM